ncbi:carbohydrate ABC transporter permease [Streptomyces rapamycinicus]|uniref:Transporter n=2 Tax=Streptomyces rapamycinicus TaxID=1226757 RepID=A0A0A0NR81_STRRN|nr:sugar ABC transporter permease [Streptomyces rapamycinicus]AGP58773.1 transporter [Streptomyces rapamycinicus NRRL 5491]MBB4786493.1 multiple sugar transport system permease protein [Streptomyces rapamycinicus]RLV78048.1 transporter [Streptomyces rapamycinicus NRRL 5491]UTO66579.1 sugar ABC transporter permease [Streptomyces rapamycinicus]UTP34533.1 sugar ABC transporter permease [Streptomyces rapamycinicus NRRL 5491]
MAHAVAKPPRVTRRRTGGPARRLPYLLIAPAGLLMLGFIAYPMLSVLYYSLRNYNVTKPWRNGYAGLDNFTRILTDDPQFWDTLVFSGKWVVTEVLLQLLLGLALALLVNQTFLGRGLARALVFSPWAVSGVLTTTIWMLLYNPSTGISRYLADAGIGTYGTSVLSDTGTVFWAAVVAELWRGVPFFAILLLADLQSIPRDLYEAASVDGAGRTRRFLHITLPHLKDAIVLSTLLRGVWEFNNVDLLYTLTGGGPAGQTTTLPLYVANTGINGHDFGYASALTTVAFVILLFCSILYLRLSKFGGETK